MVVDAQCKIPLEMHFSFIFIKTPDKKISNFCIIFWHKNNNFSNEIKLRKKQITNLKTLGLN